MSDGFYTPIKPAEDILCWISQSWGLNNNHELVWARDGGSRGIKKGDKVYEGLEATGYKICRTSTRPRKKFRVHHIVWFLYYGEWPNKAIDHIDGNRSNNNLNNLRLVTRVQNSVNRGANKNRNLPKGVYKVSGRNKYVAMVNNKYAGSYDTPELAREAAVKMGKKLYGGFYK